MVEQTVTAHAQAPVDDCRLAELLVPARELILDVLPEIPHTPQAVQVPAASEGRRGRIERSQRTLNSSETDKAFGEFDRLVRPVHDIAVMAFQRMLDQLAGFACPTLQQNTALVEQILLRADQFGFGLYRPTEDGMERVRMGAYELGPAQLRQVNSATAEAGKIRVTTVNEPGTPHGTGGQPRMWKLNALPLLIAARSKQEAEAVWAARQSDRPSVPATASLPPTDETGWGEYI